MRNFLRLLLLMMSSGNAVKVTSYAQMKQLLSWEGGFITNAKFSIDKLYSSWRRNGARAALGMIQADRGISVTPDTLEHPISQFKLIRRFVKDWPKVDKLLADEGQSVKGLKSVVEQLKQYKSYEIAIDGILRIQGTYNYAAQEIQRGLPHHTRFTVMPHLDARECYDIGRHAYIQEGTPPRLVNDWMRVARSLIDDDTEVQLKIDILDHLGFTASKIGDSQTPIDTYQHLQQLRPDEDRFAQNVDYYTRKIREAKYQKGESNWEGTVFDPLNTNSHQNPSYRAETAEYERLCRSELVYQPEILNQLTCFYWNGYNNPYLLFQPYKAEMLHSEPMILRFYDVLSDFEIDTLISLGEPQLKWATVQDPATGQLVNAAYRISESAWLRADSHAVVSNYRKRISMITGLTMERAEDVQLANYGIGGQYEPHYDHATEYDVGDFGEVDGNRIGTWLSYMSEPKYGGGTIFMEPVAIRAEPIKGSAVFWYNLTPSGHSDYRTRHAACPVVGGEKWVSNIWLHERGEEFTRPCTPDNLNII